MPCDARDFGVGAPLPSLGEFLHAQRRGRGHQYETYLQGKVAAKRTCAGTRGGHNPSCANRSFVESAVCDCTNRHLLHCKHEIATRPRHPRHIKGFIKDVPAACSPADDADCRTNHGRRRSWEILLDTIENGLLQKDIAETLGAGG